MLAQKRAVGDGESFHGRVAAIVENIVQISNMYLDRCTVQFPQS